MKKLYNVTVEIIHYYDIAVYAENEAEIKEIVLSQLENIKYCHVDNNEDVQICSSEMKELNKEWIDEIPFGSDDIPTEELFDQIETEQKKNYVSPDQMNFFDWAEKNE